MFTSETMGYKIQKISTHNYIQFVSALSLWKPVSTEEKNQKEGHPNTLIRVSPYFSAINTSYTLRTDHLQMKQCFSICQKKKCGSDFDGAMMQQYQKGCAIEKSANRAIILLRVFLKSHFALHPQGLGKRFRRNQPPSSRLRQYQSRSRWSQYCGNKSNLGFLPCENV